MPFTLCHPAIVIPLHRYARHLTSLPALVIGSMAPDFVYFFSLGVSGSFSHSLLGVLFYCVPAGALVYIVYYAILKRPFLAWLPQAISARMAWQIPWPLPSARAAAVVLGSLAIGALTHVVWDAFTHDHTPVVNRFALLRFLIPVGGHEIPLFKLLQHMSSLIGFIVIAAYAANWLSRSKPVAPYPASLGTRQRLMALTAVAAAGAAGGAAGLLFRRAISIEHALFNFVVTGMATAAVAIVLLCVGWNIVALCRTKRN